MIVDAIVGWLGGLVVSLLGALPTIPVPSWIADGSSAIASIMSTANSLSVWFPTTLVLTVVLGVLAVWGVSFLIRVVRMGVSHVTGGGGAA